MAITQAMLDAERERVYDETADPGRMQAWDACLAFLREHGQPYGPFDGPRFVRVEIPADA